VYTATHLAVPWYPVLGNHDYRGSVDAQAAYARRNRRWRMPARTYACRFDVAPGVTALFACLDTTPFIDRYHPGGSEYTPAVGGVDTEAQLAWLERVLGRSDDAWRVVVGHHPVLSGSPFHGAASEFADRLRPLLEAHGVHAYLCGHERDLQHLRCGRPRLPRYDAAPEAVGEIGVASAPGRRSSDVAPAASHR
jgi:acid phosphatase